MSLRTILVVLALLALVALVMGAKRRRIMAQLSGRTPEEARQFVIDKASPRVGPERAERIADRVVARLDARGMLARAA